MMKKYLLILFVIPLLFLTSCEEKTSHDGVVISKSYYPSERVSTLFGYTDAPDSWKLVVIYDDSINGKSRREIYIEQFEYDSIEIGDTYEIGPSGVERLFNFFSVLIPILISSFALFYALGFAIKLFKY